MQIIQIPDGIDPIPVKEGQPLMGGCEYICTNAFAGVMLLSRYKVSINGEEWSLRKLIRSYSIDFEPFDPDEDWNNKEIWLYRGGGFGDLLMLTPLIRELKSRWPRSWINVACGKTYWQIFKGLPVMVKPLPIPYDKRLPIDALIEFEELVEGDPKARRFHMAQLFADKAGITLTNLIPDYKVLPEELEWAKTEFPKTDLPRIGIQVMASALCRTYPHTITVMTELAKKAQVLLLGTPGQIQLTQSMENVINLMDHKLSFRHSAALVSTCDVCVSPDSALVHLCSALDVPCICLYGPFPSDLRLTSPKAYAFNGIAPCAPCFFHADMADQWPEDMPCTKQKRCVALESIDPKLVVEGVFAMLP